MKCGIDLAAVGDVGDVGVAVDAQSMRDCRSASSVWTRESTHLPTSEAGALSGVTLASVVHIARDLGIPVSFEAMRRDDLYVADEAFLTGTAAEVVPIASVDDRTLGEGKPGPISKRIQETYLSTVRGEVPRYAKWLSHA